MTKSEKVTLLLLRVSMGWLLLYAGYTKVAGDEPFTAAQYLTGAVGPFAGIFHLLAQPGILPFVNFITEWGEILLGIALILGVGIRWTSLLAAIMMVLFYLPLKFPTPVGAHSYIVDDHLIYALAFLVLWATQAGNAYGLGGWLSKQIPALKKFLS